MADQKQEVRIFYSWQSDSPSKTNRSAIRKAIEAAASTICQSRPDLAIKPDEATRDTAGSPNIVAKILEKIEGADILVADVTTITPSGASRPCPNPNVSHELGYAVAHLGWERIILVFNDAHGRFPADMPFDFAQHRALVYTLSETDGKLARDQIVRSVEMAVTAIIDKQPKRPSELRGLSREKIQHDQDVENMKWMMSAIHLPTMDPHISELPHMISDRALWFFDHLSGVVVNSLFYLHDDVLRKAVDDLYLAWRTALSHDGRYHETSSGNLHVFSNPGDTLLTSAQQADWDEIAAAGRTMRIALDTILARLREGYVHINLRETNEMAWKAYIEFKKDAEETAVGLIEKKPPKKKRAPVIRSPKAG